MKLALLKIWNSIPQTLYFDHKIIGVAKDGNKIEKLQEKQKY